MDISTQATKVAIREFRENLADHLESKTPVAVTRHGATIGIYVPTKPKPRQADLEALHIAGEKMQMLISAAGTTEDEIVADFKKRRAERRVSHAGARREHSDSRRTWVSSARPIAQVH